MGKDRVDYWDNAKGILIFLVVIGHLFEKNSMSNSAFRIIHDMVYCFHMPAFIMISGYFTKQEDHAMKALSNLLIPYIFLNYIAGSLIQRALIWNPFISYYGYWYLLCLCVYRILRNGLIKLRYPMVTSVVISLASGLWTGNGLIGGYKAPSIVAIFHNRHISS